MITPAPAPRPIPLLTAQQIADLKPELADVIEYRKSGLSLNHIIGCPLDCGYCVRHLFGNFEMKIPRALMSDAEAVQKLVQHRYFRPDRTPIQIFNRATDPMLLAVKPHTFNVLKHLDQWGLTNHVLVITRWRVDPEDCAVLNSFSNIRLTVLVTHSGINDDRIEPVDSRIAATSLRTLHAHAERYRTILYWRPIVLGLNDTDAQPPARPGAVRARPRHSLHRPVLPHRDRRPKTQLDLCASAWKPPDPAMVTEEARALGAVGEVDVTERAIIVEGLDEPPRYYLQHSYGYQCHDRHQPHHHRRHGRADIGWPTKENIHQ